MKILFYVVIVLAALPFAYQSVTWIVTIVRKWYWWYLSRGKK